MVTLRLSKPSDAGGVSRCVDAIARERRYLASIQGFSTEQTRHYLEALIQMRGVQVVAVHEAAIVGWCDVMPLSFEGMRHVGRLGMGLIAAYRGQGLGRRLLEDVVRRAFDNGLSRIELDVFSSNQQAVRLYERFGFIQEGRKRDARVLDGHHDDILLYGLLRREWESAR